MLVVNKDYTGVRLNSNNITILRYGKRYFIKGIDENKWGTYQEEESKLSIRYPDDWTIAEQVIPPIIFNLIEYPDWGGASGGLFVTTIDKTTVENALAEAKLEVSSTYGEPSDSPSEYPKYSEPKVVKLNDATAIIRSYFTCLKYIGVILRSTILISLPVLR